MAHPSPTDGLHEQVTEALRTHDGSLVSAVSLLTGLSVEELDALGGVAQ